MNVTDPGDPLLPPPPRGRRSSARRGCARIGLWGFGIIVLLLVIAAAIGWWWIGTEGFGEYVRTSVESTLEGRLGREVTIGRVEVIRRTPHSVVLHDLRIANAPGGAAPAFATVKRVVLTGNIESFLQRRVKVGRIDVVGPSLWFEILPDGNHNFPKWKTGPKRPFEIVRIDFNRLFVRDGAFSFNDRRREIVAVARDIDSDVTITRAEGLYAGIMNSPQVRVHLQEHLPFDLTMRGGFRYTPGVLALQSIALKGRGIEAFVSGRIDPITEGVYDLSLRSRLELARVKEIFKVEPLLEGQIALDTRLRGKAGEFRLAGGWSAPRLAADAYELADLRGRLDVTGERTVVDIERAGYGGGTVGAHYVLSQYAEPYPMRVDLRYNGISLEHLFTDWGVENTGLRGAATGALAYRWNKEKILEGAGEGSARLARTTTAFSNARYPIPLAGSADFALDRGVVSFRRAELDTDKSHVSLTGSLRIEKIVTDLRMAIRSTDFSELDRIAYNFAHSAGKRDFDLLGLGGAGTIAGTVSGPIEKPQVDARVSGTAVQYGNVLLGDADLGIRYNGNTSTLTFERGVFVLGGGRLVLDGSIVFPERGPGPRFDLAVEASGYPAQRAVDAVGLDFRIGEGLATGRLLVAGTPENGRVTFAGLTIRRADATLALNGTVNWLPGDGNVRFDLEIAANNFPVTDIATFLDFANLPVTGDVTGTLRIAGGKKSLEGAGSVTVRKGAIMGEPIELASADIAFTEGRMRATNVLVRAAAGEIRGEAEVDLANERFNYTIQSASLDVSRIGLLQGIRDLFGGRVVINSTGAGTFENPELVVELRLEDATLRGLNLPAGTAPPSIYLAIRGGRLIVRGAIADVLTIDGEGTVGPNLTVDGLVRVTISDIARAAKITAATATLPASGNAIIDLRLSGALTPLEALVVEATVPTLNLRIAAQEFTAPEPLRVTLRSGRFEFDSFVLRRTDSTFAVTGFAEITGARRLDIDVRGVIEASLLQLFVPDARAEGNVDVAVSVTGTMTAPSVIGTADLRDAEVRFAGFPQLIDEINGRLRFSGDRILIESLRATVGGGSVVAGGFIALEGMRPESVRITLQGTGVALRYYEGVTIEGNFALLLTGDFERMMLQGDVDVTRALYFRDFDVQQTLLNVILARSRVTPVAAATWQEMIGLRIRLAAPGTLAVQNNIADVTGSAALDVTGTVGSPVILGEVTLDEGGTVRIQNVEYRVARGTIAFQNPFRIDPFFDVTIEGTVAGFGAAEVEGGPFEVTVNVTGTLDRLTPSITSDPPASDITLFSILGFGGLGGGRNGQQAGVGLLGQSLLYQSLSSLIGSRVFPFVDSFAYDPGTLDTSAGATPKVTFEKRLSNNIRFLLVYNLDNQQSRQVIEWLVNPTWTLQLTRDETDEYRLDARFRRRFEAQWEWRRGDDEDEFARAATVTRAGDADQRAAADASVGTTAGAVAPPRMPPVTAVNTAAADDRPVARIDFRADAPFNTQQIAEQVTLAPGRAVTIRELQSSIKNLYATGNFRDVRVDATPSDAGVVVTFSLFLHYRVDEIEITGLGRADRARAQRELTVRRGEVLSLDAIEDSASEVEQMLHQQGFLQATVDAETTFDRVRSLAEVTFDVNPGPLAKVATVLIEGTTAPYTPEELIKRMTRQPGKAFNVREAREDANRMRNYLVRRDYRRADVDYLGHTYDEATQSVTLRYRAQTGPKVEVAVAGIERRAVRRWLPFGRSQEYSEDAVQRAADRITEGLQLRGHYLASVDTESALENNVWTTTFHVSAGPRFRVADVRFNGNIRVNEDDLHGVVQTTSRGGFRRFVATLFRRPTGVTRAQLTADRDALESFYRLQGFSQATVGQPAVDTSADGLMTVEFPIAEGPQTLVTALRIEGIEKIDSDDLPPLQLEEGGPLDPQAQHDDVVALQTFYANRGHVEVQVTPRVATTADLTGADVTYVVAEGPQVNVDEVIVRGNTYTDRDVVLRRAEIDPGQPFSYTRLLEAQRELYRLGIFQRVDIQSTQTDTTVADRDVVVRVEEGRNLTVTGAIGLRADRATRDEGPITERIAAAAAHRNLFGTGRYLGLELVYGGDEREAYLTYREPFISRWNVPLQLQIYQSDDSTRFGSRFVQQGTSIEATKVARLQTRWSARYEYKLSRCEGGSLCRDIASGIPVADVEPSLLNIQISSLTPTFFWDTRDDIIDPRRGFFTSASVEYAFPVFSATAGFLKEYLQGAYYIPLTERTVFALSGRLGLIQAYARYPQGFVDEQGVARGGQLRPIPLSERFTAGGETTHRGFGLDRLGTLCYAPNPVTGRIEELPRSSGCEATLHPVLSADEKSIVRLLPIGGSSLLLFNAEYRFPMFGPVGGAIFADVGNVFAGSRIRFDDLRYGAGFGVRYLSPVGPLRVDFGLPFQRRWYEDPFQYFVTLGYAF